MKQIKSHRKLLSMLALTALLAACSQEPSQADIEKSARDDLAKAKDVELHSIRKVGCVEAINVPGYICDVEMDVTVTPPSIFGVKGTPERRKSIQKMRMYKDNGAWRATKAD